MTGRTRHGGAPVRPWRLRFVLGAPWLVVIIAACGGGSSAETDSVAVNAAAPAPTLEPVRIAFERGPCKGRCPSYRVELDGDGNAMYKGVHNVLDTTRHVYTVPAAEVRALAAEMARAGFFAFDGAYPPYATDHATVSTTLAIGDRLKTIEHNFGAKSSPPYLDSLYRRIDALAGTARWIGRLPDSPMKHGPDAPAPPDGR